MYTYKLMFDFQKRKVIKLDMDLDGTRKYVEVACSFAAFGGSCAPDESDQC